MSSRPFSHEEAPCLKEKENNHNESQETYRFKKESRLSRLSVLEKVLGFFLLAALIAVVALIVVVVKEKRDNDDNNDAGTSSVISKDPKDEICTTTDCVMAASRIHEGLDLKTDPCDDFYQFSCGRWMAERVIPEDSSSLTTFSLLRDQVKIVLKNLLEAKKDNNDPDFINKAKSLYASCMNLDLMNEKKDQPLKDLLTSRFDGWPMVTPNWDESKFDIVQTAISMWQINNNALFLFYVGTDSKNSNRRILKIDQADFGMPGQKYYIVPRNNTMLMAYQHLIYSTASLLGIANETSVMKQVEDIVNFEIELAKISVPDEDRRDNNLLYNNMTLGDIHESYKEVFDWRRFIETLAGLDGVSLTDITDDEIIINQSPTFFDQLTPLLQRTPKRVQANYMMWRVVYSLISKQTDEYREILQEYIKVIYGQKNPAPRYDLCTGVITDTMGQAVGKLFIKDNFNDDAKIQALEMIGNLQSSFDELLVELDWMDEETKKVAKDKNSFIQSRIGYPEHIKNDTYLQIMYENLTYTDDDYFGNGLNTRIESFKFSLRNLRQPVDKKWNSAPSTVNAYYSASNNRIMFPAGILQPPFFSPTYPKSLNYGGIGVVIGHEITHGFDDRGRQYDKDGNLVQWWTPTAVNNFKSKAQCIINQYNNFTWEDIKMNVNGINTQGENIADNGGLAESFRAYRNWVSAQGKEEMLLPGLDYSHNQLFFINFAQLWCNMVRDGLAINRIKTGVHSPGQFRVIGSVQNSPEFSEAFKCKPGSPMNTANKCKIW